MGEMLLVKEIWGALGICSSSSVNHPGNNRVVPSREE